MFYSHEVLTSRKYGVATVWLVATLGQKTTLTRKIGRKAILSVDVQKACETILTPEAPMALRLQSNLLYGVTRVYSQQCGYVLADCQIAQNNLRTLYKIVRAAQLDEQTSKARNEQLVLEDDPTFLPDLLLAPMNDDLLNLLGATETQLTDESLLRTASLSLEKRLKSPGGLVLPSSDSGGAVGFEFPGGGSSVGRRPSSLLARGDETALDEADFHLDADGDIIEHDSQAPRSGPLPVPLSDAAAAARVRQEHHAGQQEAPRELLDIGLDLDMDDNYQLLSSDKYRPPQHVSPDDAPQSETAAAPQRKRVKVSKIIALDRDTKLRSRDLITMSNEYMDNMAADRARKHSAMTSQLAKDNALHFIIGSGINGVGDGIGRSHGVTPLAKLYSGTALFEMVTGMTMEPHGQKRDSEGDEATDAERRVRPRLDEVGRADGLPLNDDGFYMQGDDLEIGRDAPEGLEDISSAMPWNVSARGSSIVRGLSGTAPGLPGSIGSLGRRGSRMISASPLHGRGRFSGLENLANTEGLESDAMLGGEFGGLGGPTADDEFELYGPAAAVDTQTAAQPSWQKAVLDRESNNFLGFIEAALEENEPNSVDFEDLLPPAANSRIVAAQALLHVLTLATKNLIVVKQPEAYGSIGIRLIDTM
ncbi:hypothetical protein EJ08DRAFT_703261 [Tothia fuscella]|uniref:Rad21/Rec8-like protein N-terminal domain-containing protein n=1 Tax=Tothia fuscella TaxID=1048955 RepID=A0A9P4NEM4_9PEZI|nr:hypothetical protein EJ08DRAFT_703261 [Tothia fuscella]